MVVSKMVILENYSLYLTVVVMTISSLTPFRLSRKRRVNTTTTSEADVRSVLLIKKNCYGTLLFAVPVCMYVVCTCVRHFLDCDQKRSVEEQYTNSSSVNNLRRYDVNNSDVV
jgi:hypothetical protein